MKSNAKKIMLVCPAGHAITCRIADRFWSRFMGLMGKSSLNSGEGLLITRCNSIHMFFMKFAIDAVFLDGAYKVIKIVRGLKPGKLAGEVRGACQVLEVSAGTLPDSISEDSILKTVEIEE